MTKTLAAHRDEFVAEFAAIEETLLNACTQLNALMTSYRLNDATLMDAQAHALAGVRGLRGVAEAITPGKRARPVTVPARLSKLSLADQLAEHRAAVAQTLALVQHLPGSNGPVVSRSSSIIAAELFSLEGHARSAAKR